MSTNLIFALQQLKNKLSQGNQKGGELVKKIEVNFELKPNTLTPYYPLFQFLFVISKDQFGKPGTRKVNWTEEEKDVYALYAQDMKGVKKQSEIGEEIASILQRAVSATSQGYYSHRIAKRNVKHLRTLTHDSLEVIEDQTEQMSMPVKEEKAPKKEIVAKKEVPPVVTKEKEVTKTVEVVETKQVSSSSEGLIVPAEFKEAYDKMEQLKKLFGGDSEKEKQQEEEIAQLKESNGKLQTDLESLRGKLTDVRVENNNLRKEKQELKRQNDHLMKHLTEIDVYMKETVDAYGKMKTFINVQSPQKPESLKYEVDYSKNSVKINK